MNRRDREQDHGAAGEFQAVPAPNACRHPAGFSITWWFALGSVFMLSACAGPEKTFKDAHDVVTEVIDLTVEAQPSDAKNLYALEERVETACGPIFKNANRQWLFGEIPLYAQLEILVSTHQCRRTVDDARRVLDAYQLQKPAPADTMPGAGAVIYSN